MTAQLIPVASETEWLAARRKGITASEIAVLMGLSPYSSPYALFYQKTGDLPGPDDNLAMALGRHLEDFVARQFADLYPHLCVAGDGRTLYAHPERPWQLATPDRQLLEVDLHHLPVATGPLLLGLGPVAVLECKTSASYDGWGDDGSDEIPVHYRCQVLWQMDVLGVSTGYVACLFLHSRQLRVYELTLDVDERNDLDIMRAEAQLFLHRIRAGAPPGIDWRPATSDALKRLHPDLEDRDVPVSSQLAGRYMAACRNLKAAEQKRDKYANQIRAVLGNGRRAVDPGRRGQVIARRDVYDVPAKTIERKAFTVSKLVPVTPKEPS